VIHIVGPGGDGYGRHEKISSIIDGTSNTIMVSEYHTRTQNRRRAFWAYSYTSFNQATITEKSPTLLADFNQCAAALSADNNPCKRAIASLHPGGLNSLKADGSVVFLKNSISMRVLMALSTIQQRGDLQRLVLK